MNGPLIAKTVDAIRIYRTFQKHDDIFGLDDLFKKDLVFESKDKQFVERIVIAAQQTIMHLDCERNPAGEHFHVVLLDNKEMRAGYFLLIRCEGGQYAIIRSLQKGGGSSIYYNSSLLQLLNKELPPIGRK
jgi:hypothetical protein